MNNSPQKQPAGGDFYNSQLGSTSKHPVEQDDGIATVAKKDAQTNPYAILNSPVQFRGGNVAGVGED